MPFRLLDLPTELRLHVFRIYFEGTHITLRKRRHDMPITGMPSLNLELACRLIKDEARTARGRYVGTHLVADERSLIYHMDLFRIDYDLHWVRQHIRSFELCQSLDPSYLPEWQDFVDACPRLHKFHLSIQRGWMFGNVTLSAMSQPEEELSELAETLLEEELNISCAGSMLLGMDLHTLASILEARRREEPAVTVLTSYRVKDEEDVVLCVADCVIKIHPTSTTLGEIWCNTRAGELFYRAGAAHDPVLVKTERNRSDSTEAQLQDTKKPAGNPRNAISTTVGRARMLKMKLTSEQIAIDIDEDNGWASVRRRPFVEGWDDWMSTMDWIRIHGKPPAKEDDQDGKTYDAFVAEMNESDGKAQEDNNEQTATVS